MSVQRHSVTSAHVSSHHCIGALSPDVAAVCHMWRTIQNRPNVLPWRLTFSNKICVFPESRPLRAALSTGCILAAISARISLVDLTHQSQGRLAGSKKGFDSNKHRFSRKPRSTQTHWPTEHPYTRRATGWLVLTEAHVKFFVADNHPGMKCTWYNRLPLQSECGSKASHSHPRQMTQAVLRARGREHVRPGTQRWDVGSSSLHRQAQLHLALPGPHS